MKIGIISDIHNNLEALKVVLNKFNEFKCEMVICAGDIIGLGPNPEEVVELIINQPNFYSVKGNHDRYLQVMPDIYPNDEKMDYEEMEHHKWEHKVLSSKSKNYINSLPYIKELVVNNKKITVLHYTMNEEYKCINYIQNPTNIELENMFSNLNSDIIIYGHNHNRSIIEYKGKFYINPGSLGCPSKDKDVARAVILVVEDNVEYEILEIKYDVNKVLKQINDLDYPSKEEIKKYFYGL